MFEMHFHPLTASARVDFSVVSRDIIRTAVTRVALVGFYPYSMFRKTVAHELTL